MKNVVLFFFVAMISNLSFAVCTSPISRTNFSANSVLTSTKLNADINAAYTQLNELPGDCITDETVTSAKIDDGTIVNADISASAAIARSKLGAVNYTLSTSSASFSTTSTSYVDVTNLTATITATGGLVELSLQSASGAVCYVGLSAGLTTVQSGYLSFVKASSSISEYELFLNSTTSQTFTFGLPGSAYRYIDAPTAGAHTYKVQGKVAGGGSPTLSVSNCTLLAREL